MALTETFLEDEIHPIDIVEHLAEHHEWEFDRIEENQIAMAVSLNDVLRQYDSISRCNGVLDTRPKPNCQKRT